jgi:hypothetical protein
MGRGLRASPPSLSGPYLKRETQCSEEVRWRQSREPEDDDPEALLGEATPPKAQREEHLAPYVGMLATVRSFFRLMDWMLSI